MNIFKKISAAAIAAALMTTTAAAAHAEEARELKLLTEPISSANGGDDYMFFNGGYFAPYYNDTKKADLGKMYRIGEKELAEWRETGKFTFTNVESDVDLNGFEPFSGSLEGNYCQFVKKDADGNVTERKVLRLDKDSNKLTNAYDLGANWHYTRGDGYSITNAGTPDTFTVTVYDPSGNKTASTVKRVREDFWSVYAPVSGDNVGYVAVQITADAEFENMGDYVVYAVKKNGSLEQVYKAEQAFDFSIIGTTENGVMFADYYVIGGYQYKIYSSDTGKIYELGDALPYEVNGNKDYLRPTDLSGKIYGTKAIVSGYPGAPGGPYYALIDMSISGSDKIISRSYYKSMSTLDGKLYLVETFEDKWGYIDENGKELAFFDDAGEFIGDHAPVVKDGKAYLIDRNMNKVSEEISGTGCNTSADGLYTIDTENGFVFVTYAKPDDTTSDPVTSEPTSSEPISSEPTSSEPTSSEPVSSEPTSSEPTSSEPTSNEPTSSEPVSSSSGNNSGDNPGTGIAIALIPIALAGGAAAAVTRRKKK